jgi:hypothetical protein
MKILLNKTTQDIVIHSLKQMRNLELHWQIGKIFFRENDKKISIKFFNKKSNQIFLIRDLYKNNIGFYNKKFTTFNVYKSMFFWCTTLEEDVSFKNILQDINGYNNTYQNIYLRKKKVVYFLKLKTQNQFITQKIIKHLLKIKKENILSNFIIFKNYKTLFKFFFKKLILKRIYKLQIIQVKLEKFLFIFLLRCKNYKKFNKQQFKLYFFSKKSFIIPITQTFRKKKKFLEAQKNMIFFVEKVNYYNFIIRKRKPSSKEKKNTYLITLKSKLNKKKTSNVIASKKKLKNILFKKYIRIFLKIKKIY